MEDDRGTSAVDCHDDDGPIMMKKNNTTLTPALPSSNDDEDLQHQKRSNGANHIVGVGDQAQRSINDAPRQAPTQQQQQQHQQSDTAAAAITTTTTTPTPSTRPTKPKIQKEETALSRHSTGSLGSISTIAPVATKASSATVASAPSSALNNTSIGRQRVYKTVHINQSKTKKSASGSGRSSHQQTVKWVTREIAALDFLLNIPMQAEQTVVHAGWLRQQGFDPEDYLPSTTTSTRQMDGNGEGATTTTVNQIDLQTERDNSASKHGKISTDGGGMGNEGEAEATVESDVVVPPPPVFHPTGKWWDKWIPYVSSHSVHGGNTAVGSRKEKGQIDIIEAGDTGELERPENDKSHEDNSNNRTITSTTYPSHSSHAQISFAAAALSQVPGRRLEGDEATKVQIPLTVDTTVTRQRSIARQAAVREWELRMAHGLQHQTQPAVSPMKRGEIILHAKQPKESQGSMLDGRMFFSAAGGYPMGVYSILRYEPRKEEAIRRRRKIEALGGGGTQFFVMPGRDWRGISYRQLLVVNEKLHRRHAKPGVKEPANAADELVPSNAKRANTIFNRFARHETRSTTGPDSQAMASEESKSGSNTDADNNDGVSSVATYDSQYDDTDYKPGQLDDPDMVQGRHRNVIIGDRDTGCIVSSTIQFVKPALLKADLNQQFRDRFDGWEPPKSQRKYIGARVVDGIYTLMEPVGDANNDDASTIVTTQTDTSDPLTASMSTPMRKRKGSVTSLSILSSSSMKKKSSSNANNNNNNSSSSIGNVNNSSNSVNNGSTVNNNNNNNNTNNNEKETIRMPPSLTLSKIRSIKMQALRCAIKAKLELGTVALAFVYFERLCLDCRVDKTNRRLSFAACLLLAIKMNESHVALMTHREDGSKNGKGKKASGSKIQSFIRPTKTSSTMFACVLEFFTQDWSLSLQHVFAAEWGVFAALQFNLHATPSQVAFHFKRLLKSTGWDARNYLGSDMYGFWQEALSVEEFHKAQRLLREERQEERRNQNRMLQMQREFDEVTTRHGGSRDAGASTKGSNHEEINDNQQTTTTTNDKHSRRQKGLSNFTSKSAGSSNNSSLHGSLSQSNDGGREASTMKLAAGTDEEGQPSNHRSSSSTRFAPKLHRKFSSSGNLIVSPQRSIMPVSSRLTGLNKLLFGKRNISSDRLNMEASEPTPNGTATGSGEERQHDNSDGNNGFDEENQAAASMTTATITSSSEHGALQRASSKSMRSPSMPMIAGSFSITEEDLTIDLIHGRQDGEDVAVVGGGGGHGYAMSEAGSEDGIIV